MKLFVKAAGALAGALLSAAAVASYHSTQSFQMGAPGVAMEVVKTKGQLADTLKTNEVPAPLPPATPGGQLAVDAYKNVQVLGHLSSGDFTRLMTAMTVWVAPNNGCAYCHAPERDKNGKIVTDDDGNPQADLNNMQSDELYTKRVARRMLQMTMHLNADWKTHVKTTGVTCWTCHRGNPVPKNIWFDQPESATNERAMGSKADQNSPAYNAGLSSLPSSSFRPFLSGDENIRVQSTVAIGSQDRASIKQTEWTYALMMHFSNSLGVNCTFCHNTRSMGEWSTSPVTREQAWYGIRMVRDLNNNYLEPLTKTFPENRLGVTGDGPKVNCATCHQGAYKPLLGVSMLGDYPVLSGPQPQPQKTVVQASPSMVEAADGGMVVLSQDGGGAAAAVGLANGASDGGLVTAVPDGAAPMPNALTTDAATPSVPTSGAAAASARKPSAESPHP